MTTTLSTYIGRDKGGYAVYKSDASGKYFIAPDQESADRLVIGLPNVGQQPAAYLAKFGPIEHRP